MSGASDQEFPGLNTEGLSLKCVIIFLEACLPATPLAQ